MMTILRYSSTLSECSVIESSLRALVNIPLKRTSRAEFSNRVAKLRNFARSHLIGCTRGIRASTRAPFPSFLMQNRGQFSIEYDSRRIEKNTSVRRSERYRISVPTYTFRWLKSTKCESPRVEWPTLTLKSVTGGRSMATR